MERDDEKEQEKYNKKVNAYYDKTRQNPPKKSIINLVRKIEPGNALELGTGAGIDSIYLLKNNWNVKSVDMNDVQDRINSELTLEEMKRFEFIKERFENLKLEKDEYNLVIAYYSLHFLKRDNFFTVFEKIKNSIKEEGYFSGTFLGNNDSWKKDGKDYTFLTEEEIRDLFSDFKNLELRELDEDGKTTGSGKPKHWHVFKVIAKK